MNHGVPSDALLFDLVGDARFVLIGEASHGTHEFYAARASMTRRLIEDKGFTAVAVEADWPDAYRVNRYIHDGRRGSEDQTAEQALRGFTRFPAWMWRNTEGRGLRDLAPAKIVVWAHNSHLGDARATEVSAGGELNLGQLVRERDPDDCRLIGFTTYTYTGTVTAADNWGGPAERKRVRPLCPAASRNCATTRGSGSSC